jgi:putative membrane protein
MNVIKGFIVGASMLVPGFSGGTMAMILGIYDKLIASLSGILSFSKNENYIKFFNSNSFFNRSFAWNDFSFKTFIGNNRKIFYNIMFLFYGSGFGRF